MFTANTMSSAIEALGMALPGYNFSILIRSIYKFTSYIYHRYTSDNNADVSYSDECRTKTVLSVCEKNVSAFSCNSEVLQYQQIIHLSISKIETDSKFCFMYSVYQ